MRLFFLILFLFPLAGLAQPPDQADAAAIRLKLQKLNFLGSVLYLAAHPDDENTQVISWLANGRLAATGYLSLTRGDGGQNLIGPEIREWLGVIRTQELLAARRVDGGEQFFTRAVDFGYSKSADEAFSIWGRDAVMADAIRVIRQFKPDVIITRFPPDERAGHGHHTASALVARDAFDLAARADVYPAQVRQWGTWQVKRLYTNTGRWWNTTINENTPGVVTLNVGGYSPLLGASYTEISARASSQHKSQGWGRPGLRGDRLEFLEHQKGPRAVKDIFEGVDTTWNRLPGGAAVQALVNKALDGYDATRPWKTIPALLEIRKAILALDEHVWRSRKLRETEELIVDCLGLYAEATATHFQGVPGEQVKGSIEIVNRSPVPVTLQRVTATRLQWDSIMHTPLAANVPVSIDFSSRLPATAGYSGPYWLQAPHEQGLYTVADTALIGKPENPPALSTRLMLKIDDTVLPLACPVIYKWVDPVAGELWRPFEIVPPVVVNVSESVMVFGTDAPRDVRVVISAAGQGARQGHLRVRVPEGWRAEPASVAFTLPERGSELAATVRIYPSARAQTGVIRFEAVMGDEVCDQSVRVLNYDHFPRQTLLFPAEVKAVRIDLQKAGKVVGYIPGAGDEIPAALRNMGYEVWVLADHEINADNLRRLDAVVLGVRALNTHPRARYFMPVLFDYVHAGGTLVVQYNTTSRLAVDQVAPFSLEIGRDRVTNEDATVTRLRPEHPVLQWPNRITDDDFDNWIQERGLYFPSEWSEEFKTILSMHDPGESAKESSLLVARYGDGHYVYTGLSFFRQLPEGVAGAYKLFANLVSLGQSKQSPKQSRGSKRKDNRP